MNRRLGKHSALILLSAASTAWAANTVRTWDGDAGDGSFNTAQNWSGNTLPGATAGANADTGNIARLGDVASGNRIVTVDSPITVGSLEIVQTSTTGTNTLRLNADLSLSQKASISPYPLTTLANSSAGVDHAVIDLHGNKLLFTNDIGAGVTVANTLLFSVDGSMLSSEKGNNTNSVFNLIGAVSVSAAGTIRQNSTSTESLAVSHTVNVASGATVDITAGSLTILKTGIGGLTDTGVLLNNVGTISLAAGAGLSVEVTATGVGNSPAAFANTGVFNQGGAVTLRSKGTGGTAVITNDGVWSINGTAASLNRASATTGATNALSMTVGSTGVLRGSSAADAVEYNDSVTAQTTRRMTIVNLGTIAAGAGSAGSGLTSVGTLTLADIDLTLGATGKIVLDVGGTATGQYDTLTLANGSVTPGGAGTLDLSTAGDTLDVKLVNGFAPPGDFQLTLITAGTLNGVFDNFLVNGASNANYQLVYSSTSVGIQAIPEPSTLSAVAFAGLGMLLRRSRRRKVCHRERAQ